MHLTKKREPREKRKEGRSGNDSRHKRRHVERKIRAVDLKIEEIETGAHGCEFTEKYNLAITWHIPS